MRFHITLFLGLLVFTSLSLYSQDIRIEKIFNSNGLITDMKLDQNGLVWVSSFGGGLYHFNGTDFEKVLFQGFNENDSSSLVSKPLTALEVDSSNNVWIGTYGDGLQYYNQQSGIFKNYKSDSLIASTIAGDEVVDLLLDRNQRLWVGTENGLSIKEFGVDTFKTFYPDKPISALYQDDQGNVWVCFGGKLNFSFDVGSLVKYNIETEVFETILSEDKELFSIFNVFKIKDENKIWVAVHNQGVGQLDLLTKELSFDNELSSDSITQEAYQSVLFEDSQNFLWLGIYNRGMYQYQAKDDSIIRHYEFAYLKELSEEEQERIYPTSHLYDSDVGIFWIGTDDGIYSVQRNTLKVPYHPFPYYESTSMYLHRNVLLIATSDNGLVQKNLSTGETRVWNVLDNANFTIPGLLTSYGLRVDKYKKNLWIGTTSSGLFKVEYDPAADFPFLKPKRYVNYQHDPNNRNSIIDNQVNGLIIGRDGKIWMATASGLSSFNPRSKDNPREGEFKNYVKNSNDNESLGSLVTVCVEEDFRGDIWVGGDGGISRLNRATGKFTNFPLPIVKDICVDQKGVVWAATRMGIYYFDQSSKRMRKLSKEDIGISIENVIGINEYWENVLWVTTKDQIIRIDQETKSVLVLGENQGVKYNKMGWQDNFLSFDDELFIGHHGGFYRLKPKTFTEYELPRPILYLSQLKLANEVVRPGDDNILKRPLNQTDEIYLSYDQNTFSVEFTGVDYVFNEKLDYRFMLEGYNKEWSDLGSDNRIFFFQVPPNNYTLKITATNAAGIVTTKKLGIIIGKPWWLRWYAYLMYFILFSLLAFSIHKVQRNRTLRKERERVKDQRLQQALEIERAYGQLRTTQNQLIHAEKMASLGELTAGIAHEIQNPLNFVNNFSEVNRELMMELEEEITKGDLDEIRVLNQNLIENEEKILHHGKRAEEIVKSMLQHSKGTEGEKEMVNINDLADEYLRLSYHGLRAKDKTFNAKFECTLDDSIPEVMAIPQEIGRVLLNLINNAFHATREKAKNAGPDYMPTVTVITAKTEEMVGVVVKDNGPGIPDEIRNKIFQPFFTTKQTGSGTGLGLSLSYDIITKGHNGMIDVKTEVGEGTEFIFTIPIVKS